MRDTKFHISIENRNRFLSKITFNYQNNCWEWVGRLSVYGYGMFDSRTIHKSKRIWMAHRISYALFRNLELMEDNVLDHLCRNRKCVNPEHLEIVSRRENVIRGNTIARKHMLTTHCPKGHEYTMDNLLKANLRRGQRCCRECNRLKAKERYWNNKLGNNHENI